MILGLLAVLYIINMPPDTFILKIKILMIIITITKIIYIKKRKYR